jgi:hypothetical protein
MCQLTTPFPFECLKEHVEEVGVAVNADEPLAVESDYGGGR